MIHKVLNQIKECIGLDLVLCDHFIGVNYHKGNRYFNILLRQRVSESEDYDKLIRFSKKYNLINVEPNGLYRVAIFF